MEGADYKKYNILENILQKVNQKYVALPVEETKRNNKLLVEIDKIIDKLKSKSDLFANLYETKFYGGSYYDGLKVGKPNEYDVDCLLRLPKALDPRVEVSDKPGYVHVVVDMKALEKKVDEAPKYPGLEKLLDGDRLDTKKVKSWIESLMSTVVTSKKDIKIDGKDDCTIKCKVGKSGPAHTIKIEGCYNGKEFNIDVDLVPCFKFFDDCWPGQGYRQNTSEKKKTFFVVPKSPADEYSTHWRLSFQEQERELLSNYAVMKPTIRFLKKIRDRYNHKIASYYIKTIFLWQLDNSDKNLWRTRSLSYSLVMMLRKYSEYIEKKEIPYYWNAQNNLLGDLSEATAVNVSNIIRKIADNIERICDPKIYNSCSCYDVLQYLLEPHEYDIETFKAEVPVSKKVLKRMAISQREVQPPAKFEVKPLSSDSSVASSFEEIPNVNVADPNQVLPKVETMILSLLSQQKTMFGMLEEVLGKVEKCESQLGEIKKLFDKKMKEDDERMTTKNGSSASPSPPNQAVQELLGSCDVARTTGPTSYT